MKDLSAIILCLGLLNLTIGVALSNIYFLLEKIEKDIAAIAKRGGDTNDKSV